MPWRYAENTAGPALRNPRCESEKDYKGFFWVLDGEVIATENKSHPSLRAGGILREGFWVKQDVYDKMLFLNHFSIIFQIQTL